jgi:hypothetical protein
MMARWIGERRICLLMWTLALDALGRGPGSC